MASNKLQTFKMRVQNNERYLFNENNRKIYDNKVAIIIAKNLTGSCATESWGVPFSV